MLNFKLGPMTILFAHVCGWLAILATAQADDEAATRSSNARDAMFDVIIRNGEVIDGTGRDRYRADIAVRDGVIADSGTLPDAKAHRVVDATGKLVVPGFIDLHSHAESGLVSDDPARRSAPNLITQGITTVVVNQDGGGPLDLAEQRKTMERLGVGLNVVQLIGHGAIREAVMRDDYQRPATADELEQMQQHLRTALGTKDSASARNPTTLTFFA
jgi:N-acyl-D-amino-acid deacylase